MTLVSVWWGESGRDQFGGHEAAEGQQIGAAVRRADRRGGSPALLIGGHVCSLAG